MDVATARAVLGVEVGVSSEGLRAAYRARLRATHPDLHRGGDAGTAEVVTAYRLLADLPPEPAADVEPVAVPVVVEGDTVTADLPAGDLFLLLVEAAESVGDVSYADADAGLLEVVVDVAGYGACSVVLTLQGRAAAGTEAWATVEPLAGWRTPPVEVVTGLLADGLRHVASTH
jgi:hypothetical protein